MSFPGQAVPLRRPAPKPLVRDAPGGRVKNNTGPDKVPGVFERGDLVRVDGQWSRLMFVVVPPDENGSTIVMATCGCGGEKRFNASKLVHEWWRKHPYPG